MFLNVILYFVINVVALLIIVIFHKRVTTPAGVFLLTIIGLLSALLVFWSIPWIALFSLLFIGGWIAFKWQFPTLDFYHKIYSFHMPQFVNKSNGRVIGRCFPHYRKQLKHNNKIIVQDDLAMRGGTIITGSSGSGKTYGIINSIKQDLQQGKSVAFFDFKGDIATIDEIESFASNIEVFRLTWKECNFSYDPLINLDDNGRAEAILNMRKWSLDGSDEYYKTGAQLFLQKTIKEYQHKEGNYLYGYYQFLQTYNVKKELFDAYNTVLKLLELTITSNVGHLFSGNLEQFDFHNNGKQYILLVSFSSASKSLGTSITSLMLNDLMESGTKINYSPTLCLYIDEFGSCQSPLIVKDILEKGRSCGIATMLSMQDLNQLSITTNEQFVDSVLGTVNSFIIYSGATRQTAEKLAGTQIYEIDTLLMTLKKPINGKPPTAVYISKYPILERGGTEVYRFTPISSKDKHSLMSANNTTKQTVPVNNNVDNIEFKANTAAPTPKPIDANEFAQQVENDKVTKVPDNISIDEFL